MAKSSSPSGRKRAREKAQRERNQEKQKLRLEKREHKPTTEPRAPGEDPDLAGMVAGPQPKAEWFDLPEDESDDDESSESSNSDENRR
jgi:hypothetical protein